MKLVFRLLGGAALAFALSASAAELFPLRDVRLTASPFLDAQQTDLRYLMALDADRLLAPFRREAGLPIVKDSYGNWESSGLDGHMGGHYLSALALMHASTGDPQVLERLSYFVAELKKCQQAGGDGYLGGIPGGRAAWADIMAGKLHADNFSVNGKWVPWYNLHKVYAGLRDAWHYTGNDDARVMLIALSDWALALTSKLSDEQMQAMLKSEHGGMNEVLADVASMTGDMKYLHLARRFSHQAILRPLAQGRDQLTGLHANTQIPKVLGFERIGRMTGEAKWTDAARTFWQTVVDRRSVAIGGNSVKEHFHDSADFAPMIDEVEGPETCNTYNMLKLTSMLFQRKPGVAYGDYYERALYNHVLGSQRPGTGGFVYFTPMRPNHYRVYSQVNEGMWCCVGSGIESHAKYGEFIYAHDGADLYVNLFIPSTLDWKARNLRITQATAFPDQSSTRIQVDGTGKFALKLRHPGWVEAGALTVKVNGKRVLASAGQDGYVRIERTWRTGDTVDVTLPMTTRLEQMPDGSNWYAVLHGPIVLAAKTAPFKDEKLNFLAGDARMDHIAHGRTCPLEAAPLFVSDTKDFIKRFRPVPGQPLTFEAPGLVQGTNVAGLRFIPFFRLHDSRYMIYWQQTTPAGLSRMRAQTAEAEAERIALARRTVDQVAPGEQQPESDHAFAGEGADAGVNGGRHWRHASGWFSYRLTDKAGEGRVLRLTFAAADAGRKFDVLVNDRWLRTIELAADAQAFYDVDIELPAGMARDGALTVKFVAHPGSLAGGLYGLRLLR
ncbi:glycoside hydrolase family 127 protein [Pseudoduganella buxea]|uniref:Glycosyl hydrolase n=1 Tax=Pseudoduganella buxea TaxID=1949069 RepID=A0A6I3T190_9BURK|nr:glycoside hydrolase family 127 protein [Pseudoduganella buxea]MTV55094.1 glycosyl hydrolase [Pseudoduganella buxea]GGB88093.1 glycosyl hydrolase [Pseudoduganella buxea]